MSISHEHSAFRAAGQAIVALLHGAPLIQVDVEGVEIAWDDVPDADRPRADILADIAIGLGGVAAQSYFGFGVPPRECRSSLTFHCFNESQIADLAEVAELVALVDPDAAADISFQSFQQVHELVGEPEVWAAAERLAADLLRRDVPVSELAGYIGKPGHVEAPIPLPPNHDKGSFDVD
jgi:hypothetical protein